MMKRVLLRYVIKFLVSQRVEWSFGNGLDHYVESVRPEVRVFSLAGMFLSGGTEGISDGFCNFLGRIATVNDTIAAKASALAHADVDCRYSH